MEHAAKITLFAALVEIASCTIAGLTYMDAFNLVASKPARGEDPCNPLYWYPRQIPDYCNGQKLVIPPAAAPRPAPPPPLPPPMPLPPVPMPMPLPMFIPMPVPPPMPLPMPEPVPVPMPPISPYAPGPAPIVMPGYPPSLLPPHYASIQRGMNPNVNGLVSPDGALNILPFSDAYSDMLENHKQKMIRRRLQNLLDEYDHYPKRTLRRCHRRHGCHWRY